MLQLQYTNIHCLRLSQLFTKKKSDEFQRMTTEIKVLAAEVLMLCCSSCPLNMQIFIQLIELEEETFFLPTFSLSHSIILSGQQHYVFTVVACTADVILGSKNH